MSELAPMHYTLVLFEESFKHPPLWITKAPSPFPALAVGDSFEHAGLPEIRWHREPEAGQLFKITQIKHDFHDDENGPHHSLLVCVALDDLEARCDAELADAEQALANQTRRADFFESLAREQAGVAAPALIDTAVRGIVSRLKTQPAHGIASEVASEWEEAAQILQANDHLLAEILKTEIRRSVARALKQMSQADRLAVWLATADLNDWFFDEDWPDPEADFDPAVRWSGVLDEAEEKIVRRIESALLDHEWVPPDHSFEI